MSEYLVEVKQSARKSNAAVGGVVCQRGVSHRFDSRGAAESWAADLADDGSHVWIRAANPDDRSDVDAYLVGWLRRRPTGEGDVESAREREQAWLADYGRSTEANEGASVESSAEESATTRRGGERITDWLATSQ